MIDAFEWGNKIIATFSGMSSSFLFGSCGIPGFENFSLAGLVLGGGLLGFLTYKAVKFVVGIVTGS